MAFERKNTRDFFIGLSAGALGALAAGTAVVYVMSIHHWIVIPEGLMPRVQVLLTWAYENLRLSVVPFSLVLVLYIITLRHLIRLLKTPGTVPETVVQAERLVDTWIALFFGIGVIWTAVGMRSALVAGLGGLDADRAAAEGAFAILKRLVDGGIMLALSTTIFGSVGGYLLRLVKALVVGTSLQAYYRKEASTSAETICRTLQSIERRLAQRSGPADLHPEVMS